MRKRLCPVGPIPIVTGAAGSQCRELEMAQHKHTDELAARIAEADRIASEGIGRPQRGERLQVTIHEEDDEAVVKEKMEKALAEHVACYPEDAGRTVEDFRWIMHVLVDPLRNPVLVAALAWDERRKTGNGPGRLH